MWDLIVSVPDHCLFFYFTHVLTRPKFISFCVSRSEESLDFVTGNIR